MAMLNLDTGVQIIISDNRDYLNTVRLDIKQAEERITILLTQSGLDALKTALNDLDGLSTLKYEAARQNLKWEEILERRSILLRKFDEMVTRPV